MRYVTGIFALNLPAPEKTPGDWHFSALNWNQARTWDTDVSVFGDFGIYTGDVPGLGKVPVANHLRACLNMLSWGDYGTIEGMREYFIADDSYATLLFSQVLLLKHSPQWEQIDDFLNREYRMLWMTFKRENGLEKQGQLSLPFTEETLMRCKKMLSGWKQVTFLMETQQMAGVTKEQVTKRLLESYDKLKLIVSTGEKRLLFRATEK